MKPKEFFVYVFDSRDGNSKIGITSNINRRERQIKNGCGDEGSISYIGAFDYDTAAAIKKLLHARYKQYRLCHGEWFVSEPIAEDLDRLMNEFVKILTPMKTPEEFYNSPIV